MVKLVRTDLKYLSGCILGSSFSIPTNSTFFILLILSSIFYGVGAWNDSE